MILRSSRTLPFPLTHLLTFTLLSLLEISNHSPSKKTQNKKLECVFLTAKLFFSSKVKCEDDEEKSAAGLVSRMTRVNITPHLRQES